MSVTEWIDQAMTGLGQGCIVVVEKTEANLRWANNALTTNGQTRLPPLRPVSTPGAVSSSRARR